MIQWEPRWEPEREPWWSFNWVTPQALDTNTRPQLLTGLLSWAAHAEPVVL
jgi:hypothetical protein